MITNMKFQIVHANKTIPGFIANILVAVLIPIIYYQKFQEHNTFVSWIIFVLLFTVIIWFNTFKRMIQDYQFVKDSQRKRLKVVPAKETLKEGEVLTRNVLKELSGKQTYQTIRLIKDDIDNLEFECFVKGNQALISKYSFWRLSE
jgi:FlaA1/EpsC-like NDP-sugar epimerase